MANIFYPNLACFKILLFIQQSSGRDLPFSSILLKVLQYLEKNADCIPRSKVVEIHHEAKKFADNLLG
eukprot:8130496-Ditylum_brightwellii.AAC.2